MSKRKVADYADLYLYAKEHGVRRAHEAFGISETMVHNAILIGDDILRDKPLAPNAKTLDQFTPRDLMNELARRGYKGKLSYTKEIDITNF